jgi:microcystin degradation protein MlrC
MMMHETNTFSPVPTPLESFRPLAGPAAIEEFKGTNTQLGGFLDVAQRAGADIVVPFAGGAHPSGHVERRAYEDMCDAIVGGIRGGCDAAFLALHGAMVAEHVDDGEGELLRRIRAVAPRLPIAVGLDFHTQMTPAMVDNATVIAGYCTYPHIDMAETAQRAGKTLMRTLDGEVKPAMVWGFRPMLTSTLEHTPSRQPMKDVMDMAMAAERAGTVLNASVFGGFPQSDIPHLSLSAIVVCNGGTDRGQALLDRLLAMAWERRADFLYKGAPLASQIAHARTLTEGPVVLVDHGDNTASGGTQDVMSVVAEVMKQGLDDVVAGPICDPEAVARIVSAGTAAGVTLDVGGRIDMPQLNLKGQPLRVTGKVARITDGEFVVTGPMATGVRIRMGRTAVIDTGSVQLVVSERRAEPFDLGVFTHAASTHAARSTS